MQEVFAALLIFCAPEIWQNVSVRPSGIAQLTPKVEIFLLSAYVKQPVDRACPAKDLAARLVYPASIQLWFRFGFVHPVDLAVPERFCVTDGDVDPGI